MARKAIVALVVVLVLSVAGLWAQSRKDPTSIPTQPQVISGEDIGVRVDGSSDKTGRVQGTLVVRVNGQWVEVVSPARVIPVK